MSNMFNVGKFASNLLDSIDSVAKDTLENEEEEENPSAIRLKRRGEEGSALSNKVESADPPSEEVERLHAECLELEKQVESLTDEVKRAWGAYKGIQEKMVAQEAELNEEISALENSRESDNASLIQEVTALKTELEVSKNRFDLLLDENKKVIRASEDMKKQADAFLTKEASLLAELAEAKACSSSNAAIIREQLIIAESSIEIMRKDHSAWMLQNHKRQEQLEQSNAELAKSLAESQRNFIRLKNGEEQQGKDFAVAKELEDLRNTVESLTTAQEELMDKYNEQSRQSQAREREARAAQLLFEDERKRYSEVASRYAADVENLKVELSKASVESRQHLNGESLTEKNDLEEQNKQLSLQLLRKQTNLQELLAERSALKVRVYDLTTRCTKAEEQVSSLMYNDFESGTGDDDESGGISPTYENGVRSIGMQRRKNSVERNRNSINIKSEISSDLERSYGVKTAPAVARAVNCLDTWAQLTGRYLRADPLMRLVFVFYLVFLHLWAFAVLVFHAHSLEEGAFAPPGHPQ